MQKHRTDPAVTPREERNRIVEDQRFEGANPARNQEPDRENLLERDREKLEAGATTTDPNHPPFWQAKLDRKLGRSRWWIGEKSGRIVEGSSRRWIGKRPESA